MSELDDDSWLIGITIDNVGIVTSTLNDSDIEDIKEYELDVEMFPHTADIHNGVSGHVETIALIERI